MNSIGCSEDDDLVSVYPDDSSVSAPEVKPAPIHELPEQRALFEKTLAAIRHIVGDRWRPGLSLADEFAPGLATNSALPLPPEEVRIAAAISLILSMAVGAPISLSQNSGMTDAELSQRRC